MDKDQRPDALSVHLARSWELRRSQLAAMVIACCLLVAPTFPGGRAAVPQAADSVRVIVRALGAEARVEDAAAALGGKVTLRLGIINGFAASVPASAVPVLRADPAVASVTPDAALAPQTATYDPSTDMNSMASSAGYSGAAAWWRAGYTGAGVDVALIDSGVSPVMGLAGKNKLVYGPDLSPESQASNLTNLDTFGHGTFMAGLIAGHDPTLYRPYDQAPASRYRGMAPDARIVSVKVATSDGGTDVSQVIAAIDWVVQHAHDPGFNMRIINLSYGTDSAQAYTVDPLAFAAEQAWKHGIVVVAAGGNFGFQKQANSAPALADPAIDPYVIAVGSSDSVGTATLADDTVPSFSPYPKRGSTRSVDLLAPGAHIQGLRDPNSFIDINHPEGMIDDRFFRGSGTSQSAAIVSGAAALVLQKYPNATPDQVKELLRSTGYPINAPLPAIGGGELRLAKALATPLPHFTQTWTPSTGVGSLEEARGTDHLVSDGVALTGEQDIMGSPFAAAAEASLEALAKSWSGGTWNSKSWSGNGWSGTSWASKSWSGNSWTGASWSSKSWSANSWTGASWSSSDWSGVSWSSISWSGASWSTGDWS